MAYHRHPSALIKRTKIDVRAPDATILLLEQECAEAGISRNELICRKLARPTKDSDLPSTDEYSTQPLPDELFKYILETHYIIMNQFGNSKGRRMESLALEAAADARRRLLTLSSITGIKDDN